ncbi:MAG: hypothetical protein OHK0015_26560 [Chloroflexi bacterium OHK40]
MDARLRGRAINARVSFPPLEARPRGRDINARVSFPRKREPSPPACAWASPAPAPSARAGERSSSGYGKPPFEDRFCPPRNAQGSGEAAPGLPGHRSTPGR